MNTIIAAQNLKQSELEAGSIWFNDPPEGYSKTWYMLVHLEAGKWVAIDITRGDTSWMGIQTTPERATRGLRLYALQCKIGIERN